jgi:lantibiotic modifying enzyme
VAQVQTDYLGAAIDAARWIRSTAGATEHGLIWQPDPDQPRKKATISPSQTIYSGNAGVVLFFLELARSTGDDSYLDDARKGADEIAATWPEVLTSRPMIQMENAHLGFNSGLSGTAFVLEQVHQATGDPRYHQVAREITLLIVDAARPSGSGVEWVGAASAGLGDGAIVLYLLWASEAFEDQSLWDLAVQARERILEVAQPDPRGGLKWTGFPMEAVNAPAGSYSPNFEFGTAGVAYVLARLYEETGDARFLDAAREGETQIEAIATVRNDAALVFYREPDHTDLFYLGFCHGPAGTARLPYQMYKITGEERYLEWAERLARGIVHTGAPEKLSPGLWNVVCQCCGTAGILDFVTSLWIATGKDAWHEYARRVADVTLARAERTEGDGLRWPQAWTRVQPDNIGAETGYMIGAAGVGSALLHLHLAEQGRYEALLFPDNPFPRTS